jgi:muramidase (phage lysozyme)
MSDVNRKAFLDMIADSEIGAALLAVSDNGYNVIVGSTARDPDLFDSYADHPRKHVELHMNHGLVIYSTAAGRYQLLAKYYDSYKKKLKLADFSPVNQDAIAIQQIKECRALPDIDAGRIEKAVLKCDHIWASFPGAGYKDQHENKMEQLTSAYQKAGGRIST